MLNAPAPRRYDTSAWPTWLIILGVAPVVALGIADLAGFSRGPETLRFILLAEVGLVMCGVAVLVLVDALSPRARKNDPWRSPDNFAAPEGTLLREVSEHQRAWNSRVDGYLRKAWRTAVAERDPEQPAAKVVIEADRFADPRWDDPVDRPAPVARPAPRPPLPNASSSAHDRRPPPPSPRR
jgi:hypothetical protein